MYEIIGVGPGIAQLETPRNGLQIWTRVKTRKPFRCRISGMDFIAGEMAYRPLGNPMNRGDRISAMEVNAFTQ